MAEVMVRLSPTSDKWATITVDDWQITHGGVLRTYGGAKYDGWAWAPGFWAIAEA